MSHEASRAGENPFMTKPLEKNPFLFWLVPFAWLCFAGLAEAGEAPMLWNIGRTDGSAAEFALAPGGFRDFINDPCFMVGWSDPAHDWPYAHPGPSDGWAGHRSHTFTISFSLKRLPKAGECALHLHFVDTHSLHPPLMRIVVNGRGFTRRLPAGAGDASIHGDYAGSAPCHTQVTFPTNLLRKGENEIAIITDSGSWAIYDALALQTPPGAALAPPAATKTMLAAVDAPRVLIAADNALMQPVRATVRHHGEPVTAVLRVSGAEPQSLTLTNGSHIIETLLPATDADRVVTASLEIAGEIAAAQETMLRPVRHWTVYLMHHTHLDIGYTHLQTEVEERQWAHIEKALEIAETTRDFPPEARFKWLPEGLWAVDSYLRRADAAKKQRFLDAVLDGTIGLDALYGNQLSALCRPEELIELTGYARRFAREYGIPIDTAMISDVPGYTWGIIPVLAQSGVRYFSIGPNAGHRIGHTLSTWGDRPFYWVSPSGGEEVLCWVAGKAYSWFHSRRLDDENRLLDYLDDLENRGFPYEIVQVRYNIGGDNGPPDPMLPDFVRRWNEKYAFPKLVIATTKEAFASFEERYGATIPRIAGDFTPYWEDGAASSALETGINRAAAERLVQANAVWALTRPKEYPAPAFHEAWRNVLLYDEHTWGAHNSISEPESDFALGQWRIKQSFALEADRQSRALLNDALGAAAPGETPVTVVLVFNTQGWTRDGLVTLPADWRLAGELVKDEAGRAVASQRLSTGELVFKAGGLPPFSARRFTLHAAAPHVNGTATAHGNTLRNGLITVRVDADTGAVASLTREGIAEDLVCREDGPGLNDFLYVAGRDPKDPKRNAPPRITIKESGPLVASLQILSEAPGCRSLMREMRLIDGMDHLEIVNIVDKELIYTQEAVHLAFPFHVPGGMARMDIPWAVARIEEDLLEGACKNYFTVQRWVDVSNAAYGATLATVEAPLFQVGGITNDPVVVGWLREVRQPATTLYAYLMNNYWETNYKAAQEGPTPFRFAIRPHGGFDAARAQRFGMEISQPLIAVPAAPDAAPHDLPLRVTPDEVIVTMLKPADDGSAIILRLFNACGQPRDIALDWGPNKPERIEHSNLFEETGEAIQGTIRLAPWAFATLRIVPPRR